MATNPYDLTGGGSTSQAATSTPAVPSKWTKDQITGYLKDTGLWDGKSPINEQQGRSIHAEAVKYGVTAAQMDEALGLGVGTSSQFTKNLGLRDLNGQGASYTPSLPGQTSPSIYTPITPATPRTDTGSAGGTPAGIVEQAQQRPQAEAAVATPAFWHVGDDQLVQTHLNNILKENGPLMQRAAAFGDMQANARGLVSSSLGVQAAQGAMIDRATPIATSDAGTYAAAGRTNAELGTQAALENARAKTSVSQFNTEQGNIDRRFDVEQAGINSRFATDQAGINSRFAAEQVQRSVMQDKDIQAQNDIQQAGFMQASRTQQYDAQVKMLMQTQDIAMRQQLAALDNQVKVQLADFEAKYKTSMQTSASMAQSYQSYMNSVTEVILNKDLDGDVKASMIAQLGSSYNSTFKLQQQISGLNLGELLTGGTVSYTPKPKDEGVDPVPGTTDSPGGGGDGP
jgi:hypothetical protein